VDPDRPEDAEIVPAGPATPEPVAFGTVFRWSVAVGLGLLAVAVLAFSVYAVRQVLVQILIAMFIAVSLDPAVRWLIRRGMRRSIAVGIIFTLTLALLTAFLISITPPLAGQAAKLADDVPGYFEQLKDRSSAWRQLADEYGLTERLTEWAASLPGKVGADAFAFVQRFLGAVLKVLLVIVLTIYIMVDLPRLRRGLVRLFPYEKRPKVAQAVNVMVDKVGSYMIGNLIISLVAGVTSFLVLWALDVPFALPLAVFVAITDLIPLVGATIGAVGCVAVSLFTVDLWPNATLLALFFLAYQQLENYLIAPRILKNTVDLSSIAVLLAALIGGTILGVVGALMAIPIAAAIKVLATPVMDALNEQPERPAAPPPIAPTG
jgi:predicted PurR-regulated permease PerM